jgi:nucleoside-diphosphate-sugar epimerase
MAGGLARGVLVTGASGFLGRHLLDVLAEAGVRTSVLVRPGTDRSGFEGRPVELREADYGDPASLRRAVCGVAAVFHLGAVVDDTNEVRLRAGNVEATRRLATACLETISAPPRFVYALRRPAGRRPRPIHAGPFPPTEGAKGQPSWLSRNCTRIYPGSSCGFRICWARASDSSAPPWP